MANDPTYPLTGEFDLHWHQTGPHQWQAEIIDRRSGNRDRVRQIRHLKAFLTRSLAPTPAPDETEPR